MFPTMFRCICPSAYSGEDFLEIDQSRHKNYLWWSWLLTDQNEMSIIYRGSSIHAAYQVSVHLATQFQRRRLKCEKLMDDERQVMAKALWQGELKSFSLVYIRYNFIKQITFIKHTLEIRLFE